MNKEHPITPPPEMIEEWASMLKYYSDEKVFTEVARWGADQELEACCVEVAWLESSEVAKRMRERRRPKPPSLKEQALGAVGRFNTNAHTRSDEMVRDFDTIRRALEALPE